MALEDTISLLKMIVPSRTSPRKKLQLGSRSEASGCFSVWLGFSYFSSPFFSNGLGL